MLKTKYVCRITGLRFYCSDFDTAFLVFLRANQHCAKMFVAFSCNVYRCRLEQFLGWAESSLSGFTIIQHFLAFGKYSKSGPIAVRVSHRFFISHRGPAPLASFANQHCFVLEVVCSAVINCPGGRGVLPYKGLMGTFGQPGHVFRDFCLKQGIEFIIFCLNQGIALSIFVLNRMSFLGR